MFSRPFSCFLFILLLTTISVPAHSAEDNDADEVPTLEQVTVVGHVEAPLTGSNKLNRDLLDALPAKNGSINEAISILPGVQMPEQGRASTQGGEILPPNLSISGSKTYENNLIVDGINNNSLLSQLNNDPTSFQFVPGHPQAMSLDTSLLEEIKVYRYNIPVSYGNFTGGVVDSTTRHPDPVFWGEINYRSTRDEWTDFHIDRELREDFENSN